MTGATSARALTVPEAMAALRLSRTKLYDLLRSGALPSFTIGRSRRIPADGLVTYMRERLEEEQ